MTARSHSRLRKKAKKRKQTAPFRPVKLRLKR